MKLIFNTAAALKERENKRLEYARRNKLSLFRRTYSIKSQNIQNSNTGKFWDRKFSKLADKANYVELDRNLTAYNWIKKIVKPGTRVLNVGCGSGKFEKFCSLLGDSILLDGIDIARVSIKKLCILYPHFNFWVSDITSIPIKQKYEIVCVFEVLEHISENKVLWALNNLYKAIKRNGFLLVAVPLNEPLDQMFPNNPNAHVRMYTPEIISTELKISGFMIIKSEKFTAFEQNYSLKKMLSRYFLKNRWKPNDILILAQKK